MSSYDDILRMRREADRILAPLRDFERLYGRGFQQVAQDLLAEKERSLRAALPDLGSSYRAAIASFQPAVDCLRDFGRQSSAMALVAGAHEDLSALFSRHAQLEDIARASIALSPQWEDSIAAYPRFAEQASAAELALKAHYTSVAESALLAQERLLSVPWEALGSATTMHVREFAAVSDNFTTLANTYGSLIRSLDEREHFMAAFPPIVSSGPPVEILTGARVLDLLSRRIPDDAYPEADREIESDLEDETEASVDELLTALNPDLRTMWLGAKEALRAENPDRRRHVAFSLRELVTHVLHTLAPNDAVGGWTTDPSHFHDGSPTREARILFVCRGINHGCFTDFIRADVRASVAFIRLFQRGHELAVSFTEDQLHALVTRTESFLRFLLLTSRTVK
jgi:hypothetical protein